MSKRLLNAIENFSLEIFDKQKSLMDEGCSQDIIDDFVTRVIDEKSSKILNFISTDLDKAYIQIGREINKLNDKLLDAKRAEEDPDAIHLHDLQLLEYQMKLLEHTIVQKKLARQKKGEHPLLTKHIDYPIFSVDKPKQKTLDKLISSGNVLIEKRGNGFRAIYFKNERGTYLTEQDSKIFSCLCKLWEEKGRQIEFDIEIREIAEAMKTPMPGGGDYESIRESLMDIYSTSLVFEDAKDESFEDPTTISYHRMLQSLTVRGKKFTSARIRFHDYIQESLLNGEYTMINMYLLNDLSLSVSKSLYRFVLNEMKKERKDVYTFEFTTLRGYVDVSRDNQSRAYQVIKKGLQQLVELDVITNVTDVKLEVGNWMFYVTPHPNQLALV
ncbi:MULTISPECIES: hypothetical protein [unclassified Paenibacillus]|uniref:hypothetical protein n=1 Tax=unclassified Paenibacillus TaxID=185978 RepID=UPI00277ECFFF|nr:MULTISPECIES: hypothetical protein [unclassified Paenibacillus]MDQ0896243.1 hypothetical protein [Paenibacillus sp. V4I7]MDQ0913829.1 hypothetical protein [Paenibacillus sp. V4I5]